MADRRLDVSLASQLDWTHVTSACFAFRFPVQLLYPILSRSFTFKRFSRVARLSGTGYQASNLSSGSDDDNTGYTVQE